MYRLNANPLSRFPEGRPLDADRGRWMVARLKSRMEKALALELAERGMGYYLPLYVKKTIRPDNNKPRKSLCPLFPGYLAFVAGGGSEELLKTHRRVVNILPVRGQDKFVRELSQIQRVLQTGAGLEVFSTMAEGDLVRVRTGPLRDVEGVVQGTGKTSRLAIGVEMFGQYISLEMPRDNLEKIQE